MFVEWLCCFILWGQVGWQMGVKATMMDCRRVTFPWHLQSLVYDGSPEHVTSSFIIASWGDGTPLR